MAGQPVEAGFLRRKVWPWVASPLSMLLVVGIGMSSTWAPDVGVTIPRIISSDVGPSLGAIGVPVDLEIPSVGIKAAVVPIKLEGDQLNPPGDVRKVGWWDGSAQPGSQDGQTLMTGHAVHTGGGVMNRLGDVERGASVLVRSQDEKASFIVEKVFVWSKEKVAEHSEDLFDPDLHGRRLVLVTCADWDGRAWESNVIVFAQPV